MTFLTYLLREVFEERVIPSTIRVIIINTIKLQITATAITGATTGAITAIINYNITV
jgi:hypothetical protein